MAFRDFAYLQTEAAECGLACLAACAAILGDKSDLASLRRRFSASRGMSLHDVNEIASRSCRTSPSLRSSTSG
jgi:ATP-binding cassette subfamily B protein RaxB